MRPTSARGRTSSSGRCGPDGPGRTSSRRPSPRCTTAATAANTDWAEILALNDALLRVAPTPVVELNRAVAVAMVLGPGPGLAIVDRLVRERQLLSYSYLDSARADLLRRLGRPDDARHAYQRAAALTANAAERAFLERRLAEVTASA